MIDYATEYLGWTSIICSHVSYSMCGCGIFVAVAALPVMRILHGLLSRMLPLHHSIELERTISRVVKWVTRRLHAIWRHWHSPDKGIYMNFSCPNCEKRDTDGNRYFDGIDIDGTAHGILRTLPNFLRHAWVIPGVTRVPYRQYLIRDAKIRSFLDFVSRREISKRRRNIKRLTETVLVAKKTFFDWKTFSNAFGPSDEAYSASCLLTACFRLWNSESRIELDNTNSDDMWE